MQLNVEVDGRNISFECDDTLASRWVSERILEGRTYPHLPFVGDVDVVVDAGANCGAATVHLARVHPGARVHSLEPASRPRSYLERNTRDLSGVTVHPFGLHSEDATLPLYHGVDDSITGSLFRRDVNVDASEEVEVRHAGRWAEATGIDRIDVLKLDVEGIEVEVLESFGALTETVKVLYVEYDGREARRRIDAILAPSHELYFGMLLTLDQGECVYLRRDLCDLPQAREHLLEMFRSLRDG